MNRDEIAGGVVIFLFGMITTFLSLNMPIGTFRMAGTGIFPLLLGILLMILSGMFILKISFQLKKDQVKKEVSVESSGSPLQMILFLGAMVLATLFFNQLGYPLTSFLLLVMLLRTLGMKRWTFNIFLSFMTVVVCYFLFVQWLKIPLPKGWIGL